MRSHLALVVVAVLGLAACTRTLQSSHSHACADTGTATRAHSIGIIGMSLDQHPNTNGVAELVVDRVVPDGPAATAGIRPGDRILEIEGAPTRGMTIGDAARRLRGPIAASVVLVVSTGSHPRDVTITRVAPSELWSGTAGSPTAGKRSERVRASDVAPAADRSTPPCRH
jgi:S1-C subfamily serine protease